LKHILAPTPQSFTFDQGVVAVSVEYFAYTTDPSPVSVADLTERCRRRGYEIGVLREFADWSRFQPVVDGAVESDDVVCGWSVSDPAAPRLAAALERRSAQELASREAAGRLGVFEVEIWDDPAEYNADLEDEADGYSDGYAEARAASAARWYIRIAAGRGELSTRLPEVVLGCVLELRGGLFDDPQECQFRIMSPQR
jgi:hypothetical protein